MIPGPPSACLEAVEAKSRHTDWVWSHVETVPIEFQFDSWQCPVSAVAQLALDRLIVADELTQRQFVAFTGTSAVRLVRAWSRWLSLTFGSAIPLTHSHVAWQQLSGDPPLVVRITPGWPADFSVTLRCLEELGGARLHSHLESLLRQQRAGA
jgi:hypothetical protein